MKITRLEIASFNEQLLFSETSLGQADPFTHFQVHDCVHPMTIGLEVVQADLLHLKDSAYLAYLVCLVSITLA